MTRILHSYTDVRPDDQLETFRQLATITHDHGNVISQKMVALDDYWAFLLRNWNKDDLINIEQDVVATTTHIYALRNCVRTVCVFPYRLAAGQWSVFDIDRETTNLEWFNTFSVQYYNEFLPRRSDGTSIGLIKINKEIQAKIPLHTYPVDFYGWWYLDSFISWHLKKLRIPVHIHHPEVKHNRSVDIQIRIAY